MVASYPRLPQQLPQTSSAVNIQIIEPKNYPGGAVPGQINQQASPASFYTPPAPPYGTPQQNTASPFMPAQSFPTGADSSSANYNTMFPAMDPKQSLQNAYAQALKARNSAEQARNSYLNMANQLNSAAYQPQPQYYPQPQPQQNFYPQQPMANPFAFQPQAQGQVQGAQYYPQPQPQQNFYPQPQAGYYPQGNNPFAPPVGPFADPFAQGSQGQTATPQAPQQFEPPPQQFQPEPAQPVEPPPPALPTLQTANIEELNMMVDQPATLQERVDAMEEVGVRGFGTPKTYELLQREALANTDHLEGQAKDDANYVRQAALWTLGMLNKAQNGTVPTDSLPGLNAVEQILRDKNENADVKAAAVQALQVIGRPKDKRIKKILKKASRDKNVDVKRLAKDALSGKTIPIPAAALQLR